MLTLKATWSNVYDTYGQHSFQRYLRPEEFVAAVRNAGFDREDTADDGLVRAVKRPDGRP